MRAYYRNTCVFKYYYYLHFISPKCETSPTYVLARSLYSFEHVRFTRPRSVRESRYRPAIRYNVLLCTRVHIIAFGPISRFTTRRVLFRISFCLFIRSHVGSQNTACQCRLHEARTCAADSRTTNRSRLGDRSATNSAAGACTWTRCCDRSVGNT